MILLLTYFVTRPAEIVVRDVQKVSQVIGETDRQRNVPADNRTESRFGLRGTDLGASFEHKGRLVFLFGDTWPVGPNTPDRPVDGDAIAFSDDRNPDDGLTLDFVTAADGKYKAVDIPGVSLKGFEVPNGGFSAGGHMYGIYTTDHTHVPAGEIMGRSVLGRSDDGRTWSLVYSLSTDKFINVSPVIVDASTTPGLPISRGKALLMWAGSREYRRSSPYLAFVPLDRVEDHSAIRYWAGPGKWSASESDATPVVNHPEVGELSVAWCAPLKRWLMLYNSGHPRGIQMRTALQATGPWGEPITLFDPKDGYGKFMHISWRDRHADSVHDPGRENEYGGEYAPYMIPRFFRKTKDGARIYFLLSTWNPYAVVLMRADLVV
ncbi:DUF4185 domain-containing protein [Fimbriimonas ginsengisoli]|uniref:Carbohydrate-binding protein n=1 Tax=Fimbriimonas ginsengisoli Gsoil 348 TaxID=661478 RepID=A0A068NLT5_FIMGI|nr:DUF4185 domain-containing protein [Fimbriimonas ginsengisoli]AIE83730.1 carbohydrate-binding protein [Fimbriimonas ginsengisoli Gsoil 348]